MDLIIVESPSKAKTISKYLKGKYKVDASAGHIRDLPVHTLGVDIKNNFEPKYVNSEGKEDIIRRLTDETKKADNVYLATDPDREGEAISWHLQTVLGLDENKENRIEFNEVSAKAIEKALEHPRKINYSLVDAQQARRVLDRLVGYKLSTLLNHKIDDTASTGKRSLSGGRVQSVALRLIVEREREIQAFKPEEYWNLTAELQDQPKKHSPFKALLEKKGMKKYKPASAEETEKVLKELEKGEYIVSKVKKAIAKSHAPAPFTTSSMQQDASNKLGFSSPETMSLAQHLYRDGKRRPYRVYHLYENGLRAYLRRGAAERARPYPRSIWRRVRARKAQFLRDQKGRSGRPRGGAAHRPVHDPRKGEKTAGQKAFRPL